MKSFKYTITDEIGIHARPAGLLAQQAKSYRDTVVTLTKDDTTVKASQLMKLMSLAVKQGETVTISAEGPDEDKAIAEMKEFMEANL